jgi:uncharacterized protein YjlB
MTEPQAFTFADDGAIPNSRLPLLVYRAAVPADAEAIEAAFARNAWPPAWRWGVYPFHHFHSNAHEVLGVFRGAARILFGGPAGKALDVAAGDVVVIPAGVGHRRLSGSADFLVVGAYPPGAEYDLRRGDPAEIAKVRANIARVKLPASDPVGGSTGALIRLWRAAWAEGSAVRTE